MIIKNENKITTKKKKKTSTVGLPVCPKAGFVWVLEVLESA